MVMLFAMNRLPSSGAFARTKTRGAFSWPKPNSALGALFSCGFAGVTVNFKMAVLADRFAVIDIKSQFGKLCPRFDVVCLQTTAALLALLASEIILFEYSAMPFLVFISPSIDAILSIAFVAGVGFAALKMLCRSPLFRSRTLFDPAHQSCSFFGISPSRDCCIATPCGFLIRSVGANLRAITLTGAALERLPTGWTNLVDLGFSALARTKPTLVFANAIFGCVKGLPAAFAVTLYLRPDGHKETFTRTKAPTSLFDPIQPCVEFFPASLTSLLYGSHNLSAIKSMHTLAQEFE